VEFSGSRSWDPDEEIVSYEWNFDDRDTAEGGEVEHAFDAAGTYRVCLTVTDDDGATTKDCCTVRVYLVGGG